MTTRLASVVLLLAASLVGACREGTPLIDLDAGVRPKLSLWLMSPAHLATSQPASLGINLQVLETRLTLEQVQAEVSAMAIVEEYPSGKRVTGSWLYASSWSDRLVFHPDAAFSSGDQIVRFPGAVRRLDPTKGTDQVVVTPHPFNLFRVGSVLRVSQVELLGDKAPGYWNPELLRLQVVLSETGSASVSVEEKTTAWTPIATTQEKDGMWRLGRALDPTLALRISISGPTLDGKWTGVAGSGPLVLEFVPKDYQMEPGQVQFYVTPDLSIELPSGVKK